MHPNRKPPISTTEKPLVVVRFNPQTPLSYETGAENKTEQESLRNGWQKLQERFPSATLQPLYSDLNSDRLRAMIDSPNLSNRPLPTIDDPTTFYTVKPEPGQDINELIESLRQLPNVAAVYPISGPTPPPTFDPSNDPLISNQGYLWPAPEGIDIFSVQGLPGGDGQGVQCIDIEQGWVFEHEDLIDAQIQLIGGGINHCYFGHGTAVLGQIVATDNDKGIIGIARGCRVNAVSQFDSLGEYNTAGAIMAAVDHLSPGDVLLLEAQVPLFGKPGNNFPVEIEEPTLNALHIAFVKGIIVIEAAGNGNDIQGNNLNDLFIEGRGSILNRDNAQFIDSGAIVVGAASSGVPHEKLAFSNFGNRIDCYAWGENVTTTGDGLLGINPTDYTDSFGGTSGASPIIAGAAILIQAIQKALGREPFTPEQMRAILTNPETATPSANPGNDQIGVMPDLNRIINGLLSNPA